MNFESAVVKLRALVGDERAPEGSACAASALARKYRSLAPPINNMANMTVPGHPTMLVGLPCGCFNKPCPMPSCPCVGSHHCATGRAALTPPSHMKPC